MDRASPLQCGHDFGQEDPEEALLLRSWAYPQGPIERCRQGANTVAARAFRRTRCRRAAVATVASLLALGALQLIVGRGDGGPARHDQLAGASADEAVRLSAALESPVSGRTWNFTLAGRSVYLTGGRSLACEGGGCGRPVPQLAGRLDGIQAMGFDCIWLTPVLVERGGESMLDPFFGTEQELKNLSLDIHERGMCLVFDLVILNDCYTYICESRADEHRGVSWFFNLGALDSAVPATREALLSWAARVVEHYKFDAVRLHAGTEVAADLVETLRRSLGAEVVGRLGRLGVSATGGGKDAAADEGAFAGALNVPLARTARSSFCGYSADDRGVSLDLSQLGTAMGVDGYWEPDILANFVDEEVLGPQAQAQAQQGGGCGAEASRLANALAWTMFTRGVPVVYDGADGGLSEVAVEYRERLRQAVGRMTRVRRLRSELFAGTPVEVVYRDATRLVFTRSGRLGAWVFLNNLNGTDAEVPYPGLALPRLPRGPHGGPAARWVDVLDVDAVGEEDFELARFTSAGEFVARGSMPKVLIPMRPPESPPPPPSPLGEDGQPRSLYASHADF